VRYEQASGVRRPDAETDKWLSLLAAAACFLRKDQQNVSNRTALTDGERMLQKTRVRDE